VFSSLNSIFSKVAEPLRAFAYGAANFENLIHDPYERRRVAQNKFITGGTQFVSSAMIWASTMPFDHAVKQSLLYWGKPALVLGFIYAAPLSLELLKYGRQGLAQQEKLRTLQQKPFRQP
jgi:hypothetical protein